MKTINLQTINKIKKNIFHTPLNRPRTIKKIVIMKMKKKKRRKK